MKCWLIPLALFIALVSTIALILLPPSLPIPELESQTRTVLQTEQLTPLPRPLAIPHPPRRENRTPTGTPFAVTHMQRHTLTPPKLPTEATPPQATPLNDRATYPGWQAMPTPRSPSSFEQTLATLINSQRQRYGIAPLRLIPALNRAAYRHSVDMSTQLTPWHLGSDGSSGGTRMFAAGYTWEGWSEIIGWGFADPAQMVDWWLTHEEHRAILLSTAFTEFGIGHAAISNTLWQHYWTVNFGRPQPAIDWTSQVTEPALVDQTFQPVMFSVTEEVEPVSHCPRQSQRVYNLIPLENADRSHPAPLHADLNLQQRGYVPVAVQAQLVDIPGPVDVDAPQLATLFADLQPLQFTALYQIYNWNWGCGAHGCRGELLTTPETTLLGLTTQPEALLRAPTRQTSIYGDSYVATVLYAEPNRLTLAYTRDGSVANGYTVHVEQVCVDPNLLQLYQEADRSGRQQLPGLQHNEIFGTALGSEVRLAIRDRGTFLDPRSRKDWWHGF